MRKRQNDHLRKIISPNKEISYKTRLLIQVDMLTTEGNIHGCVVSS